MSQTSSVKKSIEVSTSSIINHQRIVKGVKRARTTRRSEGGNDCGMGGHYSAQHLAPRRQHSQTHSEPDNSAVDAGSVHNSVTGTSKIHKDRPQVPIWHMELSKISIFCNQQTLVDLMKPICCWIWMVKTAIVAQYILRLLQNGKQLCHLY